MKTQFISIVNESQHSISDNPGYGYHGAVDLKVHASKKKPVAGAQKPDDEAQRAKHYKTMHSLVRSTTGADAKVAKHYLDSVHGRHLADLHNDVGLRKLSANHVTNHIKKDFAKFQKHYKPGLFEGATGEIEMSDNNLDEISQELRKSYLHHAQKDVDFKNKRAGEDEKAGRHLGALTDRMHAISRENKMDKAKKKLKEETRGQKVLRIVQEARSADKKTVLTTVNGKKEFIQRTRKDELVDAGGKDKENESKNQ